MGDIRKEDNKHVKSLIIEIPTSYVKTIHYLYHL